MWNDGPAKQPWLNYFNEYELQHCCFGGDGEDGNGGGGTGTDTGKDKSTGLSAADFEDYEGIGGAGSHAAAEAAAAAAAGDAAAAEEASDRSQKGMDDYEDVEGTGFGGGYAGDGSFDIGLGYNELSDLGYAEEVDRGIQARDQQVADNMVEDASALGLDLNVTVDKDGNYTYSGADAFSAALGAAGDFYSQFSPASIAIDAGRGFYDMVTGLPGVVADIGTDLRNEVADRFGVSPSEVTQEQVNAVTSGVGPDAGIGEFRDVSPTQTAVAMGVSPQQAIDTAQIDFTNLERAVDNSGMYSGFGDMPGYSSPTESALSSDFTAMQNQADLNAITSAYEEAERARTGTQLDRDISAYEEAENAMFGGGYAGTGITPDIAFEEIQGDEPIIIPKKKEEEKEEPKSVMAQYFERLGVPSPYAPSTTQSTSPYLSAVASQPAGAPEDLFARMARIRRQEALKTPKFNYTGYAPFSPNLYAAAYGISPEEARKRIPPLPKLKQTIGFPDDDDEDETTEAYGGGGLNTLMRTR